MGINFSKTFASLLSLAFLIFSFAAPSFSAPVPHMANSVSEQPQLYWWRADKQSEKGIVVAVHAFAMHAKGFSSLATTMSEQGYEFAALSLRGHEQKFYRELDYQATINDLREALHEIHEQSPDKPIYLMGESLGCVVVMKAAARSDVPIAGIILSSPGDQLHWFHPKLLMANAAAFLKRPTEKLSIEPYLKRYAFNNLVQQAAIAQDVMARQQFTMLELLHTLSFLKGNRSAIAEVNCDIPILVMQGGSDRVVQATSIGCILKDSKARDLKVQIFPDAGHILLGYGAPPEGVIDSLTTWLGEHPMASSSSTQIASRNSKSFARLAVSSKALIEEEESTK
jgi:lysophospholipase